MFYVNIKLHTINVYIGSMIPFQGVTDIILTYRLRVSWIFVNDHIYNIYNKTLFIHVVPLIILLL